MSVAATGSSNLDGWRPILLRAGRNSKAEFLHRAARQREPLIRSQNISRKISQVCLPRSALGDSDHADMLPEGADHCSRKRGLALASSSGPTKRNVDYVWTK